MRVTSNSGRVFDLPTPEEEVRILKGIAADPDTHELTSQDLARLRPFAPSRPSPDAVDLAPEVLAYFKATGPGWQTRMNNALKEWIKLHAAA